MIYLSDFVKTWPLGFRLAPGQSGVKKVRLMVSALWLVQVDSPGTVLTVGGWIRPGGQN